MKSMLHNTEEEAISNEQARTVILFVRETLYFSTGPERRLAMDCSWVGLSTTAAS